MGGQSDPQPPLDLRRIERRGEASRFYFGAEHATFAGREAEMARLDEFLDSSDRRFSWWLACGAGGTGKSRLALELCKQRGAFCWVSGFLRKEDFAWSQWRPTRRTLIVIDYAGGNAEDVGQIVRTLRGRAETNAFDYSVRLLLLERTADGPWYDRFIGSGGDRHLTLDARFDKPLMLTEQLGDAALAAIARAYGASLPDAAAEQDFAAKLRQIDPAARPLFAALLGDALAEGRSPHQRDREALIRDLLEREDDKFWQPAGVTEADRNLLALATMTCGIPLKLFHLDQADWVRSPWRVAAAFAWLFGPVRVASELFGWLPTEGEYDPMRFEMMAGGDTSRMVPPLEPDLIGELFVLDRLAPQKLDRPNDSFRADLLRRIAWSISPRQMAWFLVRATQDYPDHPAGPLLRTVAGEDKVERQLWSMAATTWIYSLGIAHNLEAARKHYAELKALAANHPKELYLRDEQAKGAFHLIMMAFFIAETDLKGPVALTFEVIDAVWLRDAIVAQMDKRFALVEVAEEARAFFAALREALNGMLR